MALMELQFFSRAVEMSLLPYLFSKHLQIDLTILGAIERGFCFASGACDNTKSWYLCVAVFWGFQIEKNQSF